MENEIEFTLIVRPHKAWSRIYNICCEEKKVYFSTASGKDYPKGVPMDFTLHEEVEYDEKNINEEEFTRLLTIWNEISCTSINQILSLKPGSGFGGTIYSLQVEKDEMTVTFDWDRLSRDSMLFDALIDFIKDI